MQPGKRYRIRRHKKRDYETIDVLEELGNGIYHVNLGGRHAWLKERDITNCSEVKV